MLSDAKEAFRKMFPNLWADAINSGSAGVDGETFFVTLSDHSILFFRYFSTTKWTLSTEEI